MKHHIAILLAFSLLACSAPRPAAVAPQASAPDHRAMLSSQGVDAVLWQYTSAEAAHLYRQSFVLAQWRLELNVMELHEENMRIDPTEVDDRSMAVIVDIDETMLDNSPYEMHLLRTGSVYSPESWKAWTDKAEARALPGAVEFVRFARSLECEVFYISNRDTSELAATMLNLQREGFPFADEEHLMLMAGTSDKTARRDLVTSAHQVMLLVGDQLTDYEEILKDRTRNSGKDLTEGMSSMLLRYFVLLPNPMYGYWRDAITGRGEPAGKLERVRGFLEQNAY